MRGRSHVPRPSLQQYKRIFILEAGKKEVSCLLPTKLEMGKEGLGMRLERLGEFFL